MTAKGPPIRSKEGPMSLLLLAGASMTGGTEKYHGELRSFGTPPIQLRLLAGRHISLTSNLLNPSYLSESQ